MFKKEDVLLHNEKCIGTGGVVWRHDIDTSVNRALALCQIEKELGVKVYYFVYLYSLSTEDIARVEQKKLFEKNILESILDVEISHMSFY